MEEKKQVVLEETEGSWRIQLEVKGSKMKEKKQVVLEETEGS
jgi:hypothetical protein